MTDVLMAPAAGTGIGKYIADEVMKRGLAEKMVDALARALEATRSARSGDELVEEQDCRTQLQAVMWLTAHMEGEPVKRVLHQHLVGATVDPVAAMRDSPALAAAVQRNLDKARFRTRNRKGEPETVDLA